MARHSQEIFSDIESKIEETSKIMSDISHTAVEQEAGVDQVTCITYSSIIPFSVELKDSI
nr:hypothetical protein [Brachyspira hampsonii]